MQAIDDESDDTSETLVPEIAARVLEYEKAKAVGLRLDGSRRLSAISDAQLQARLECVDLLHRVWPDFQQSASPPRMVGEFTLIRELGHGGMGTVFEAEQQSMGRRVALKMLPFASLANAKSLQRFRNEVRAVAALDHQNIVSVYSIGEDRGIHYFAMQLIRGQTLAEMIDELRQERSTAIRRPVDEGADSSTPLRCINDTSSTDTLPSEVPAFSARPISEYCRSIATLGVQAASALQYAHDQGVLHRDVKPGNLLLDREGQVFIADFGLARVEADAGLTVTGDVVGTLRYMAPEQALGKRVIIDQRADVYSLGATLYELLTLEPAFGEIDRSELLKQIAFQEPRRPRDVDRRLPVELETIVLKAMAKLPEDRYQSAQGLADDLSAFLENRPISAKPASLGDRLRKWARRHKTLVRTAVLTSAILIAILSVSVLLVARAQSRAMNALEETSKLLYVADVAVAGHALEKGWADVAGGILDRHRPRGNAPDRRGLEWWWMYTFTRPPMSRVLEGHNGSVNELAVTPDHRTLYSVGADGTLRAWDIALGKLKHTVSICDESLESVAVSPDGRFVAVGNTSVYLLDAELTSNPKRIFIGEHTAESLAFSPDSRRIAVGQRYDQVTLISRDGTVLNHIPCSSRVESLDYLAGGDLLVVPARSVAADEKPFGVVELWKDAVPSLVRTIDRSSSSVRGGVTVARSSPCGNFIAAGERYRSTVFLLNAKTGSVVSSVRPSRDQLTDLAIAPEADWLAASYRDGRIEYFELHVNADGTPSMQSTPRVVDAHSGEVNCIRAVGRRLFASCGEEGVIRIWSVDSATSHAFHLPGRMFRGQELSPDGSLLLYACHRDIHILNVDRDEVVFHSHDPNADFSSPVWSSRGDRAAVCCRNSGAITIFSADGKVFRSLHHDGAPKAIEFSPDGSLIAVTGAESFQLFRIDDGLVIYRQAEDARTSILAFSNDGSKVAFSGPQFLQVLNVSKLRIEHELDIGRYEFKLHFSPDDATITSGYSDGAIRTWDLQTGHLKSEWVAHERAIVSLKYSPDGDILFSSSEDGVIRMWSVSEGHDYGVLYKGFNLEPTEAKLYLSFSADGSRLAIGHPSQKRDSVKVSVWTLLREE